MQSDAQLSDRSSWAHAQSVLQEQQESGAEKKKSES